VSAAAGKRARTQLGRQLTRGAAHALAVLGVSAVLAAGAAVLLVVLTGGIERFLGALHVENAPWVALCLGAEAVAYLGYTLAFREVVRVSGGPLIRLRTAAAVVGIGFSPVFMAGLGGGFAVDRAAMEEMGLDEDEARVRVLTLNEIEYAVLAPAACVCAVMLLLGWGSDVPGSLTLPWLLVVPGVILAGIATREGPRAALTRNPTSRLRRGVARFIESLVLVRAITVRPHRHGLGILGTVLYWAGDITVLWACLHVFGITLPWPALILAFATGYALTRRALPAGGPGAVELLLPLALHWFGAPFAPAIVAVFAYRFFTFWLALVPGMVVRSRLHEVQRSLAATEPGPEPEGSG
jgi:uncharacterized membrane protein YbhN (UPF0104 family)